MRCAAGMATAHTPTSPAARSRPPSTTAPSRAAGTRATASCSAATATTRSRATESRTRIEARCCRTWPGPAGLRPPAPGCTHRRTGGSVFPGGSSKRYPWLLRRGPVRRREVPVGELVEERLRIDGTQVLVVEVVGMLPHVHDQQRRPQDREHSQRRDAGGAGRDPVAGRGRVGACLLPRLPESASRLYADVLRQARQLGLRGGELGRGEVAEGCASTHPQGTPTP